MFHPKSSFVCLVNYGYVLKTIAPDGEEVDAYALGITKPVKAFTGEYIAVIHRTNDNDDKLIVVVPKHESMDDTTLCAGTDFQEEIF